MKKLFAFVILIGCLTIGFSTVVVAQDKKDTTKKENVKKEEKKEEKKEVTKADVKEEAKTDAAAEETQSTYQGIKIKFIEGGWEFMTPILICMIVGLAISIERIVTLTLSSTNTKKLVIKVEDALKNGGVESAKEVLRNTRGPVASIFMQGLMRYSEGIDMVEKSVIAYGSVEMNKLEKGLVWISLFIALAPMLGFFGTVVGMIFAFDDIAKAGDISPTIVADGIKVALITTVGGLIVAMILQVLYNYIVSKVDAVVAQMEDASISLIDVLVHHNLTQNK
jgi:biopolymer transport protein ExbB